MSKPGSQSPPQWGVWHMWWPAGILILAYSGTVFFLHEQIISLLHEEGSPAGFLPDAYLTGVGLIGLALVFILHTARRYQALLSFQKDLKSQSARVAELRTRYGEITKLFEAATRFHRLLSVKDVADQATRVAAEALDAQQASLMLYNPETNLLETRAYCGEEAEVTAQAAQPMTEGIAGWVALHGESLLLNPETTPRELVRYFRTQREISSALSAPIRLGEEPVGVINVNRVRHAVRFTDEQRRALDLFADHLGSVLLRARQHEGLAERARLLEEANAQLTELHKVKDAFLSTASHELKTPLTTIIGYSEILNTHDDRLDDVQRRDFLVRLRSEARGLLGIIEGILDLSRLETGKSPLHREAAQMPDLVRSAVEAIESMADKHRVVVEEEFAPELPMLYIDTGKIRQVLVNLLVNAVRYSPDHGTVRVVVTHQDASVVVSVVDRGPGVAPGDRDRIFALFGQGMGAAAKHATGLGIGLHLVKRIVELHHGDVGVESTLGEGSRFWVRLPLEAPDLSERPDRAAA